MSSELQHSQLPGLLMQQDFNLLLPAPESKDNLGLTPWLQVQEGTEPRQEEKEAGHFPRRTLDPLWHSECSHPPTERTANSRGEKPFWKKELGCTHCVDRKKGAQVLLELITRSYSCAAAPLCLPSTGGSAGWGWGFWGQRLARRKGCCKAG